MIPSNNYAIFFHGDKVLKCRNEDTFIIPYNDVHSDPAQEPSERNRFYIGEYSNKKIFGVSYHPPENDDQFILTPARDALAMTDAKTSQLISRAKHLLNWINLPFIADVAAYRQH